MNKRLIALGLTAVTIMSSFAACKNDSNTQTANVETTTMETMSTEHIHNDTCGHTEIVTEETVLEETAMTNEQGQLVDEGGNVIETQAVTDAQGNTKKG